MEHLLLLHGAIGSKEQLTSIAENLKNDFIIHTFNFSGHGGEPMPEEFSIPLFATEVIRSLEKQGLKSVNIFGYSMGGFVALYLARHHPLLVGKVITLATKFHWDRETASKESGMLNAATIREKLPQFAAQLNARHQPYNWEMVLAKTKDMILNLGENNALFLEDFKLISSTCLLLLGDKDRMVTRDETLAVQLAIPHAKMEILPDTSHPVEQVNADLLAQTIKRFIGPARQQPAHDGMIN